MSGELKEAPSSGHYKELDKIEPIEVIESWGLGFHLGNAVKYIGRHEHKGGMEDLKKAVWYIQRHIRNEEEKYVKTDEPEKGPGEEASRGRRR